MKAAREQANRVAEIEKWRVEYGEYDQEGNHAPNAPPAWLRSWLGDDFFGEVVGIAYGESPIRDAGLAQVGELKHLRWLGLEARTSRMQV